AVEGPNGTATSGLVTGMNLCPANGLDAFARFNGHHAEWQDNMQSFSNTEPAVDLTATSLLAFARQLAGLTSTASGDGETDERAAETAPPASRPAAHPDLRSGRRGAHHTAVVLGDVDAAGRREQSCRRHARV